MIYVFFIIAFILLSVFFKRFATYGCCHPCFYIIVNYHSCYFLRVVVDSTGNTLIQTLTGKQTMKFFLDLNQTYVCSRNT